MGAGIVRFWRTVHRILPLGQRYNRWIRRTIPGRGDLRVPWGGYWLRLPIEWLDVPSSASAAIYKGPPSLTPEFFAVLAPLIERLPPGTIVDVGANIGIYTLNLRALSNAPIIAFEPEPTLFKLLTDTVRSNQLPAVSLRNVACGETAGAVVFRTGINGSVVAGHVATNPQESVSVPVVRLDDELGRIDHVSLIKIDCEGFEYNVLKGCRATLERDRPILFVELHPQLIGAYGHTVTQVCDLLRPLYDLAFWDAGSRDQTATRFTRFAGQYRQHVTRLSGEREMTALATAPQPREQLFLLAVPKG